MPAKIVYERFLWFQNQVTAVKYPNEEELAALFIASRLASTIPDRSLKSSFKSFLEQIVSFCTLDTPISLDELSERISVKNIEYARVRDATFQKFVNAVFHKKTLEISYYSPHKDEATKRVIFPLHLLQYMGSWHVISHCCFKRNQAGDSQVRIRSGGCVACGIAGRSLEGDR